MDQHPKNPLANRLPTGVDEAKLVEAVKVSGYPLQSVVARSLSEFFGVVEEWGYTDRTTQEHRTLDLWAHREIEVTTPPGHVRLYLLVECKRSDLPFVFFPPGVQRVPWDFPQIVGLGHFSLGVANGTQDATPAAFFCAAESPFVTEPRLAVTFTRAQRKSKDFELSGEVPFNQVVMPLASAAEQMRKIFHGGGTPSIVLSVCVIDGPMLVASGTPEAPSLALEPLVRVVHQESVQNANHWERRNFAVDFVHREFLRTYVTEQVLPFANVLATRMIDYRRATQAHPKGQAIRPKNLGWDAFIGSLG